MEYGIGEEEEEMKEDGDEMKVKIMKVHAGDMSDVMNQMLGHGGPKMMED